MIRILPLLLALPLLIECAPQRAESATADRASSTVEIDCIDLSRVSGRRAEGPDSIRFDLPGDRSYVNRLPGRCPGLDRSRSFGALAFEVQGNRLCRGDKVRAVDPALGGYAQSIPCVLSGFTPALPERR